MRLFDLPVSLSLLLITATLTVPLSDSLAQTAPTERIAEISSLTLASGSPEHLYMATRYGLLRAEPNGMASLVRGIEGGLTSLTAHPDEPGTLLTSGYSPDGGMLGVMMSEDGGASWTRISEGIDGPAAFHALEFSRSNPQIVYGASDDGIQISRDGGSSWTAVGKPPADVIDLAASSLDADTVYAATRSGIFVSRDGGSSWQPGHTIRAPATMVYAAPDGRLFAFVLGTGLIAADEPDLTWATLFTDVADRYFVNMVARPADPQRLYASADTGAILTSGDGGKSWSSFEGSHNASPGRIAKGKQVFEEICQACHGELGVGEVPNDPSARDEFGFKAPALNGDTHAWHHSDRNLMQTISKGSPRNERMVAFEGMLSDEDVENVVAYVKTLWNFRALACQGAHHMACMGN